MSRIKDAIMRLIQSRKGLLALIGLITIQVFMVITLILFVISWIMSVGLVSFEFVKDIFVGGFTYDAGIIGAYSAANLCDKYIYKKKDENGKKKK